MTKRYEVYLRGRDEAAVEYKAEQAAAQGKWDQFNQNGVADNGITTEIFDELDIKYFSGEVSTTDAEIAAHQDYERELSDLLDLS